METVHRHSVINRLHAWLLDRAETYMPPKSRVRVKKRFSAACPRQVLSEILRSFKPGGRFLFLEHVAAMNGTHLNRLQALLAKPWHWMFDGCHLNRNTHLTLGTAGFSRVDMDCFRLPSPAIFTMPHIFGMTVRKRDSL